MFRVFPRFDPRKRVRSSLTEVNFIRRFTRCLIVLVHEVSPALNPQVSDAISGENSETEQIDAKESVDEPIEK